MKGKSTVDILLEHSKVKVELYVKYLSKYLNILKRAQFCEKIYLYDLMCGEGVYSDNSQGSPIAAFNTIKRHYYSNNKSCKDMDVWFNDSGLSDVEPDKNKIDRVKDECSKIFKPPNVNVKYTNQDFVSHLYPTLLQQIKRLKSNERLLLFLDPYGYKDITPEHIRSILCNNSVELLLFVPITPMYRFANKSLQEDFSGGDSLRSILEMLLDGEEKVFKSEHDFIKTLKEKYTLFLNSEFFVDTFTIQRDKSNRYALFFFTPHYKGFEKMLETKWEIDEENGQGFKINASQRSLFSEITYTDYPEILKKFIKEKKPNNLDLYMFGLENGYLPKQTNSVLRNWQKAGYLQVYEGNNLLSHGKFYNSSEYYSKEHKIVHFILA